MYGWAENEWKKSNRQAPENLDLIQEYYKYTKQGYKIDLRKVDGHCGHKWNELADSLATGKISIIDAYLKNGFKLQDIPAEQKAIEKYKGYVF
jgi:ribonuclease HI